MLNRHFREFLALLEKHGVRFLVVGGYALAAHGYPRYTGDLDVFIAITSKNAAKMPQIFNEFGFADLEVSEEDFLEKDVVVEIGREPLKIQVITGIDGVEFEECYAHRFMVRDGGIEIPFIGFNELLKNKAASPRPKDKLDLDELKRIRGSE